MLERLISSDDHVIEPPALWTARVAEGERERVPHVRRVDGVDRWVVDGRATVSFAGGMNTGQRFEDPTKLRTDGTFDEVREGAYVSDVHMADNLADGVIGAVLYPTLGLTMFRAIKAGAELDYVFSIYNDWMADFCSGSGGRLKGVAMVNLDDPEVAVAELTRARQLGLSGALIPTAMPPAIGYGDPRYDRVWAAAQDLAMPLSLHLGAVRYGAVGAGEDFDTATVSRTFFVTVDYWVKASLADIIFAGVFERYPRLRVGSVEHELGWIPFFLRTMDYTYTERQGNHLFPRLANGAMPSDHFRSNVFCSFQEDGLGIQHRHEIGIDNMMFGSDYPHTESTFPKSREIMAERLAGVPADEQLKIVYDNARKLYDFDVD